MRFIHAGLIFFILWSCKKNDEGISNIEAVNTQEVRNTGKYYSEIWEDDMKTKLHEIPLEGSAATIPYSGYWYPEQNGGTNNGKDPRGDAKSADASPLVKYDAAFYADDVRRASIWEDENHTISRESLQQNPDLRNLTAWFGHCNGFSAAASRHKEPEKDVVRNGITFTPKDIKALLAETYMTGNYRFLGGDRCENFNSSGDPDERQNLQFMDKCEDINPGTLHIALGNWIGIKKHAIVSDISQDKAIWNYPVYKYKFKLGEITEAKALEYMKSKNTSYKFNQLKEKLYLVNAYMYYSNASDTGEIVGGNEEKELVLNYILEVDGEDRIVGGEWAEVNRKTHPDFIWVPLEPLQGTGHRSGANPYLKIENVMSIWAESAGYESIDDAPELIQAPLWGANWGDFSAFSLRIDGGSRGVAFSNIDGNQITIESKQGSSNFAVIVNGSNIPLKSSEGQVNFSGIIKPVEGINKLDISYDWNGASKSHQILFYSM